MSRDPTYVRAEIDANPIWRLAFRLSEVDNDTAPIGWARYITLARWLRATFTMTERTTEPRVYRPDHNGECLHCDEWLDAHGPNGECPPEEPR